MPVDINLVFCYNAISALRQQVDEFDLQELNAFVTSSNLITELKHILHYGVNYSAPLTSILQGQGYVVTIARDVDDTLAKIIGNSIFPTNENTSLPVCTIALIDNTACNAAMKNNKKHYGDSASAKLSDADSLNTSSKYCPQISATIDVTTLIRPYAKNFIFALDSDTNTYFNSDQCVALVPTTLTAESGPMNLDCIAHMILSTINFQSTSLPVASNARAAVTYNPREKRCTMRFVLDDEAYTSAFYVEDTDNTLLSAFGRIKHNCVVRDSRMFLLHSSELHLRAIELCQQTLSSSCHFSHQHCLEPISNIEKTGDKNNEDTIYPNTPASNASRTITEFNSLTTPEFLRNAKADLNIFDKIDGTLIAYLKTHFQENLAIGVIDALINTFQQHRATVVTAFVASVGVLATTSGIITQDIIKHIVKTGGSLPDVDGSVASFTGNTNHPQINEFTVELGTFTMFSASYAVYVCKRSTSQELARRVTRNIKYSVERRMERIRKQVELKNKHR